MDGFTLLDPYASSAAIHHSSAEKCVFLRDTERVLCLTILLHSLKLCTYWQNMHLLAK